MVPVNGPMLYKLKTLDGKTTFIPVKPTTMHEQGFIEKVMENWLTDNADAVLPNEEGHVLVIDQETAFQNLTDILAVDEHGNVIVIEVKRGQAPRDVIAQALEYASDVAGWDYQRLNDRATAYFAANNLSYSSLLDAMQEWFEIEPGELSEAQVNQRQRIFIVGEDIDLKIARTTQWLQQRGIDIGCVRYTCYRTQEGDLFLEFSTLGPPMGAPSPVGIPAPDNELQAFWQDLLDRAREQGFPYLQDVSATTSRWVRCSAGVPGYRFYFYSRQDGQLEVQFDIRGANKQSNKSFFDHLHSHKDKIEGKGGFQLNWDRRDSKSTSVLRWVTVINFDISQKNEWQAAQQAMLDAMSRFIPEIAPYLDEMSA